MEEIRDLVRAAVLELYSLEIEPIVTDGGEHADFASNIAMVIASRVGKGSLEVAEEITQKISGNSNISCSVAGRGFVNFSISALKLQEELMGVWSEKYGENEDGAGKTAIVEFPSPNLAKPYSVGHLRPGNQGWAAKRLLEMTGWKVITDNHIGDSGTPFGIWTVGFTLLSDEEALMRDGVYELGRIYIEMKRLLKEEEERGEHELKDKVQGWLLKLEQKDEGAVEYAERFSEISLRHIHDVMKRLDIYTDYELGERFFVESGKKLAEKYASDGIFLKNEDGSIICELDGFDVPMLMLKSNGTALYATTDLGCAVYRAEEWKPDLIVHAAGGEQKFYFEQLFAVEKKIGLTQENVHLWFGMIDQVIDGKREKMSSRKGVVLMEELLDKAEATARELIVSRSASSADALLARRMPDTSRSATPASSHSTDAKSPPAHDKDISEEDIRKVAVGAIKFTDFTADRKTGILFDWEKIFALSGFSGPSVQYAAVRANKIIKQNADFEARDYSEYDHEAEKGIIRLLLEYPEVIRAAVRGFEMHKVANYVFRLAQEFNRYYEKVPVGKADDVPKSARLDLLRKVYQVFESGLSVLGIEIPEKM